jgi:ATP-dependent protease ClpP protease subunit
MSKRQLPAPPAAFARPQQGLEWDVAPKALDQWNPGVRAAAEEENTIGIYDVIGYDPWTGDGTTAKRISAALRSIGAENPVVVNINSPGGDLFEGLAIYNLLRNHKGHVTVRVISLAASAASVIAMAGDTVEIARAGFLMIHNAWVLAVGNRHSLRDLADWLEPFDGTMANLYAARSGMSEDKVAEMMDAESWIGGADAIEKGFADSFLPADQVKEDHSDTKAAHKVDVLMAKAGVPRSERRRLLNQIRSSTPGAAGRGTPSAADMDTHNAVYDKLGPIPSLSINFNAGE